VKKPISNDLVQLAQHDHFTENATLDKNDTFAQRHPDEDKVN